MIKSNWIYLLFLMALGLFIYQYSQPEKSDIRYEVFNSDNGWAYRIIQHDKIVIQQEQIPAVTGYHYFKKKKDAVNTAKLITEKMRNHQIPMVYIAEIDSMGISY